MCMFIVKLNSTNYTNFSFQTLTQEKKRHVLPSRSNLATYNTDQMIPKVEIHIQYMYVKNVCMSVQEKKNPSLIKMTRNVMFLHNIISF